MSTYATVREMKKMLQNMLGWFEKTTAFAAAKKFEPDTILTWRIAPDMFPFTRQVQSACDSAKFAAARGAGKEAPSHPDTETTFAALRARVETVIAYLDTFAAKDFVGAEERLMTLPWWNGKQMAAADYVTEHATPNFFFHATTVYALLRNNGVDVGKTDYLGQMNFR